MLNREMTFSVDTVFRNWRHTVGHIIFIIKGLDLIDQSWDRNVHVITVISFTIRTLLHGVRQLCQTGDFYCKTSRHIVMCGANDHFSSALLLQVLYEVGKRTLYKQATPSRKHKTSCKRLQFSGYYEIWYCMSLTKVVDRKLVLWKWSQRLWCLTYRKGVREFLPLISLCVDPFC